MSQAQIGNLNVKLGIDTAQFANGVKQAQGTLASLAGSLKVLATGAAAGAAVALAGLSVAIGKSLSRMDSLGKAAQKVGIPVDEFSRLEYAARLSDVSLESLTTTLARFSRSLSEISAGGNNDASAAMRALGISATDAEGKLRPTSAIIEDVAEKFSTMKDGANKTALAIALFGRSGAEMIPLLNGGAQAIKDAGDELNTFGGIVTPEAAKQAEIFNDNLTRMKEAGSGLSTLLASRLSGIMADITSRFVEWIKEGNAAEKMWAGINFVVQHSLVFLEQSVAIWKTLTSYVYAAGEAFVALTTLDFSAAKASFTKAGEDAAEAWAEATKRIGDYQATLNAVGGDPAKTDLGGGAEKKKLVEAPVLAKEQPKEKVVPPGTLDDIYGAGKAVSALEESFRGATPEAGLFSDSLSMIGDTISSGLSNALTGLISGTMSVQEAFMGMVQSIVQSLADLAAELLTNVAFKFLLQALGGGGGAGLNIGGMVFGGIYGDGGHLGSGKWGIAGERGPEIIHGPANITPMDKMSGGSMNVTVINNTPARVNTRRGADGGLTIEVVEEMMASAMSRGGNKIDDALARGYGLRRAGR